MLCCFNFFPTTLLRLDTCSKFYNLSIINLTFSTFCMIKGYKHNAIVYMRYRVLFLSHYFHVLIVNLERKFWANTHYLAVVFFHRLIIRENIVTDVKCLVIIPRKPFHLGNMIYLEKKKEVQIEVCKYLPRTKMSVSTTLFQNILQPTLWGWNK